MRPLDWLRASVLTLGARRSKTRVFQEDLKGRGAQNTSLGSDLDSSE